MKNFSYITPMPENSPTSTWDYESQYMRTAKLVTFLILVFVLNSGISYAQIITTITGAGSGGDGIPATASAIHCPEQMVIDKFGNLYFTQFLTHRIRKIDLSGMITTVAGTGTAGFSGDGSPASVAAVSGPSGIATDTAGNIYFCDQGNHRIRKINASTGIINTLVGTGTSGFSGDGGPASAAQLFSPYGVSYRQGELYISDFGNYRLRKVDRLGKITTIAGNGLPGSSGDGGPATAAKCNSGCVDFDLTGNIYMSDKASNSIRKVDASGMISTIAGNIAGYFYNGDEIPATAARLAPAYIAFGKDGLLYIPDNVNDRVRRIDALGIIHTVAGNGTAGFGGDGGPATAAQLNNPNTIAFDSCGNLYIAQIDNPRIRKVTFNPAPCPYLGVTEVNGTNTLIYPNPTNEVLNIETIAPNTTYHIYNMVGSALQSGTLENSSIIISLKDLPSGIYLLQLTDPEGAQTIKRIVKQ